MMAASTKTGAIGALVILALVREMKEVYNA
jgi:hypothetical protein